MKKVKGFDSKLVKTEVPEVFLESHCDPVPNELRTVTGPQTGCWKPLSKIMLLPLCSVTYTGTYGQYVTFDLLQQSSYLTP